MTMTPRTSLRALAREIYHDLTTNEATASESAAACSNEESPSVALPRKRGRAGQQEREGQQKRPYVAPSAVGADLMAQVRALYEDSAVPVREIARRAGVTERTLYKYVERQQWRRRYNCVARDAAVAAANRGRKWRAAQSYAPAKGAGGRFVRREDADKPHARGLAALDAGARSQASAACEAAARLSARARREAEEERSLEARANAMAHALRLARDFDRTFAERAAKVATPLAARLERAHRMLVEAALAQWEALL